MSNDEIERRFPRRLLLAGTGTAVAAVAAEAVAAPAEAAPGNTSWLLGGNGNVAKNGSNFVGTKNVAPLILKTTATKGSKPAERMRITPGGHVGIGITKPQARLDVVSNGAVPTIHASNAATGGGTIALSASSVGGIGVEGVGGSYGVVGESSGGTGTYGSGGSYGVYGSGGTHGVYGAASTFAVRGDGGTHGVYGTGTTDGVFGSGPTGVSGDGSTTGVYGNGGTGIGSAGCRGNSGYVGVWGTGNTWGIYGITTVTTGQIYGVYGATDSPGGYGVWSDGNCHVNGTLSKAAGSFKIDHPLDPEEKWLSHSFVESPDMMNVYNGNVTTGANGRARVTLPDYFHALNKDFRYQLTVIGEFAQAIVSRKIKNGVFEIRTDKPGIEVSWQVTGIRHDDYAVAHPIKVVTPKTKDERGTRQFVPAGSKAKLMRLGPRAASSA